MRRIPEAHLVELANQWEPEASSSPPDYRRATCVVCAKPMEVMWHHWINDGGFRKELHFCAACGMSGGLDKTLIVIAAYDDRFTDWAHTMRGGEVITVSTAEGGHPTKAFIDSYRKYDEFTSYLFVQDSMKGTVEDVVEPFRHGHPVVGWASFGFNYDNEDQADWVNAQYTQPAPTFGIFGPTFYATREAMVKAEPLFPQFPRNKNEAQGTERAWARCFHESGIQVGFLHTHDRGLMQDGCPPFVKVFADRQ